MALEHPIHQNLHSFLILTGGMSLRKPAMLCMCRRMSSMKVTKGFREIKSITLAQIHQVLHPGLLFSTRSSASLLLIIPSVVLVSMRMIQLHTYFCKSNTLEMTIFLANHIAPCLRWTACVSLYRLMALPVDLQPTALAKTRMQGPSSIHLNIRLSNLLLPPIQGEVLVSPRDDPLG